MAYAVRLVLLEEYPLSEELQIDLPEMDRLPGWRGECWFDTRTGPDPRGCGWRFDLLGAMHGSSTWSVYPLARFFPGSEGQTHAYFHFRGCRVRLNAVRMSPWHTPVVVSATLCALLEES